MKFQKIICDSYGLQKSEEFDQTEYDAVEKRLQLLLKEGSKTPADSDESEMTLPEYYDPVKFRLGQNVFRKNIFTMMIAKLSGLLLLLTVPSILDILKFTKQSGNPCTAFRRYAATILHTCIWYKNSPDEDSELFVSLKNVRKKHCIASKRSCEAGIGQISQLDMALTQFGFMGFTLLCADYLGVATNDEELDGLLHFWRVIGRMLGTEERFNLCNGTVKESKALCRRLLEEIFVPYYTKKSKDFEEMSNALLEGLWPINPFVNNKSFRIFTCHLIASAIPNNNHSLDIDDTPLSLYSKIILYLQLFVHKYLLPVHYWWSSIFRAHFNNQMKIGFYLTEKFPFLAYILYGRKRSYFNIYKFHFD
ncbi:GSCOCG00008982001-RA-CDS [Cotesia congregata]|uniref:ER-bound oxygenase mpaB/mpaB'/Rubber oxygenase catalytic domain-containing protein n=1 Tax=Cotesia congregata TaxID=51543 RepID=A0A8J2HTF2_COTCN|nr:GSCOCG00008982001-RA-CDS [Cotesia congregata]CAG5108109.1 Protein of unknown function [Cotesia congregata]